MHTCRCTCVFDHVCGDLCARHHSPAAVEKVPLPFEKEAAHNYKFHSEEHKERAAFGRVNREDAYL